MSAAWLTVDLGAIVANWKKIGGLLSSGQAAAVVKADGYGLGAVPVAKALQSAGCRRFFVATLDEGIALRAALPDPEILVMNGLLRGAEEIYPQHRLIPTLNSRDQVARWRHTRLPAALQIDSGLSRLGVALWEAAEIAKDPDLDLILVMSHLACADEPAHPLNSQQLEVFRAARELFPGIEGSIAASSGIFLGREFHQDWVRPGAALYGINPNPELANPMAQVVRLQAKILQLREIDAGISVGYGATHCASRPMRLATIGVGYADGLFRALSNRGHGHIGDKLVPLVGRVSMDLSVFDVTAIEERALGPDAVIDLIGPHSTIDQLAQKAGTIGYEILTALGPRLQRNYAQ